MAHILGSFQRIMATAPVPHLEIANKLRGWLQSVDGTTCLRCQFVLKELKEFLKRPSVGCFPTPGDLLIAKYLADVITNDLIPRAPAIDRLPFSWLHNDFSCQNIILEPKPCAQVGDYRPSQSLFHVIDLVELSWGPRLCDFFFLFISLDIDQSTLEKISLDNLFEAFVEGGGTPFSEDECSLVVPCLLLKLMHLAWYYAVRRNPPRPERFRRCGTIAQMLLQNEVLIVAAMRRFIIGKIDSKIDS